MQQQHITNYRKDMLMKDYLSEEAIMSMFDICRTTLWNLRKKGLPHYRVGSLIRYDLDEVTQWLRAETPDKENSNE